MPPTLDYILGGNGPSNELHVHTPLPAEEVVELYGVSVEEAAHTTTAWTVTYVI